MTLLQRIRSGLLAAVLTLLVVTPAVAQDPADPWEGFNRKVHAFNDVLDRNILKPVAKAYQENTPERVNKSISNFYSNLNDVGVMVNNLLQGKVVDAGSDLVRIILNSTLGVAGLFDFATPFGFVKHEEDFGQTLGAWGVNPGPYLVLPIFGPRNVRDGISIIPDAFLDPVTYMEDRESQLAVRALGAVDFRAGLLSGEELIIGDRYVFIRDSYLQRRDYLVNDGVVDDPFLD